MTRILATALAALSIGLTSSPALTLSAPLDYQVIQRRAKTSATVLVVGELPAGISPLEARVTIGGSPGEWRPLVAKWDDDQFSAPLEAPAGGWHRLEVRAAGKGRASVEHFGVGEIFVVAGQSNSANHGEEKQRTKTKRVATFDGKRWQLANDPQPGASGQGGSFLPPFGDAMVERFDVPIGFISCGIGASSVREWLPAGTTFPNPPTVESRVRALPNGEWESKGEAYSMFTGRLKPLGDKGFRAVLWHQGESDANQRDTTRTLPGELYREYLEKLIGDSRRDTGWQAPWFVAQVSYHVPGDESSPDIRAAQASLWKDGIALEGPDSDALKGKLRDGGGSGVHFSGEGLREHGERWADKVAPWLETQLQETR